MGYRYGVAVPANSGGKKFVWGIECLDELIGKAIESGAFVLVAGHPGAGKTLLAATICYANAVRGTPCLYVSFQEPKEIFLKRMKSFNMDFSELESKDFFKYHKVPVIVDRDLVSTLVNELTEYSKRYKVIVLDSFTPVGRIIEGNAEVRALLQNFFYGISKLEDVLLIGVAEVPLGKRTLDLGDVEFVSDVVVLLKYVLEKGLITRFMELRKAREAPLTVGEVPFKIIEGVGIRAFLPPLLEEIPTPMQGVRYEYPCKELNDMLGPVTAGSSILIVSPADLRSTEAYMPGIVMLYTALKHKLKTLVVSYVRTSTTFEDYLISKASAISPDAVELTRRFINELLQIEYINPASMSLGELYTYEIELVRKHRPQLLMLYRVDIPTRTHGTKDPEKYFMYMWNQLLWYRMQGITTVRYSTYMSRDFYRRSASVSDAIVRLVKSKDDGSSFLYVWTEGRDPQIIRFTTLNKCVEDFITGLRR